MPNSKDIEEISFINWLRLENIDFFSPMSENQHGFKDPRLAIILENKDKKIGKQKGVNGIFVFLPNKLLVIELKPRHKTIKSGKNSYGNSKVSEEQTKFLGMVNKYPYSNSFVAYGYEEAVKLIEENL